jgi:hypothetical protein
MEQIQRCIAVEVARRVVLVLIHGVTDCKTLTMLNSFIETRLLPMKDADDIKWYANKVDHFVIMPQTGWEPEELKLEIRRRLAL